MLRQLNIENFALLKHVNLTFEQGLNVLTGETGAGKSIIIDAVKLILGERANTADIRYGQDKAFVEAIFELKEDHSIFKTVEMLGLENIENTIVLSREVRSNGKNICRVNRQIVTLNQFKQFCAQIISIYGQHQYDELGDACTRLLLLDELGDANFQSLRHEVSKTHHRAKKSGQQLKKAIKNSAVLKEKITYYSEQLEELSPLQLKKGEEDELNKHFNQAAHAQDLYDISKGAYTALYAANDSVHGILTSVIEQLRYAQQYDSSIKTYHDDVNQALILLDEVSRELEHYNEKMDFDAERLQKMDERLVLFSKLRKKYGMNIDDLVDEIVTWQKEIESYENDSFEINTLKKIYQEDKQHYLALSEELHQRRVVIAESFSKKMIMELADMAMTDVKFDVIFEKFPGDQTGIDLVTFMISTNPGMPMRPLYDIASGGEMSRVMLAVKTILGGSTGIETLIFDEIDTGIGGIVLNAVADKLEELSCHEQVICVTHAPVIAAHADRHFYIHKEMNAGETITFVESLDSEEAVVAEIARMTGGQDQWQLDHARNLRKMKVFK